ncbi:MAG: hypothetical protein IMZ52_00025 [Actinobacteria bacterium]|nr:hypothetical protein [Actinomycetota bacterium]
MTPEPLKKKRFGINTYTESFGGSEIPSYETSKEIDGSYFQYEDIKSAVSGLIKFHEDRIEEFVNELKQTDLVWGEWILGDIENAYESIMAVELWLEDAL